ncbi:MAG: hypothetical protein WD053_02480 [Gracilimonas sp.]
MKKLTTLLVAILFTGGMAIAQSNNATVDQTGDDHEVTISQVGTLNSSNIDQTADAGRFGDDVAEATITQEGASNEVNLSQRAFYGDAEASITQLGDGNRVEGTAQGEDFRQNHGLNIIDVFMQGNDNVLSGSQSEAQKNVNSLYVDMLGNSNTMNTFQHYGYADVILDGDNNIVDLSQRSNHPSTSQTAYIDVFGSDNSASVMQTGQSHTANVNVTGNSNTSSITQGN